MESDTIRPSGGDTLVDVWIDGRMRAICVTRGAIEDYLGTSPDRSAAETEEGRCEFVRTHLKQIMIAAKNLLAEMGPAAGTILIDGGQLAGHAPGHGSLGRQGDRRKGERRKSAQPEKIPPGGDRRRGERRKADRRARPTD